MYYIKLCIVTLGLLLSGYFSFAQTPDTVTFKLFLIGDAGEGDTTGATLRDLKIMLQNSPNSAVIFLGDNCYLKPYIFVPFEVGGYNGSELAQKRLMAQLNILRGYKGYAYFVPGNHDWWNHINIKKGKQRLKDEQVFIEDSLRNFKSIKNHDSGTFLPSDGEPGPVSKVFNGGKTRVIFLDTYRLILEESKKKRYDSLLMNKFYKDLEAQLNDATAKKEKIIVVAHHPIHSKGRHSFPLRFAEKFIMRFGDSNANYPSYKKMAIRLDSLLKAQRRPDIYFVAGHEHSLEYFYNDSLHYLVSGAGSRIDNVNLESCEDEGECLQWNQEGFFEIDFSGRKETIIMYHRKENSAPLQITCVSGCK